MAKCRIGHFAEAQILQAIEIDYIDESEVLSPADDRYHIDKTEFDVPFVCGAQGSGRGAAPHQRGRVYDPHQGRAGHGRRGAGGAPYAYDAGGNPAYRCHARRMSCSTRPKQLQVPYELVRYVHENGKLPVVNFAAGGVATPGGRGADDAAGRRGRVRRLRHLQIRKPEPSGRRPSSRRSPITTMRSCWQSCREDLGEAMVGINEQEIDPADGGARQMSHAHWRSGPAGGLSSSMSRCWQRLGGRTFELRQKRDLERPYGRPDHSRRGEHGAGQAAAGTGDALSRCGPESRRAFPYSAPAPGLLLLAKQH